MKKTENQLKREIRDLGYILAKQYNYNSPRDSEYNRLLGLAKSRRLKWMEETKDERNMLQDVVNGKRKELRLLNR